MPQRITSADVADLKQKIDQLNASLDDSDRGILLGIFAMAGIAISKAKTESDASEFEFEPLPADAEPSVATAFEKVFGDPASFDDQPEAGDTDTVSIGEASITWSAGSVEQ